MRQFMYLVAETIEQTAYQEAMYIAPEVMSKLAFLKSGLGTFVATGSLVVTGDLRSFALPDAPTMQLPIVK